MSCDYKESDLGLFNNSGFMFGGLTHANYIPDRYISLYSKYSWALLCVTKAVDIDPAGSTF